MVRDRGSYEPEDGIPPEQQLARGKIDVTLQGEKLRGGFTLIRTGARAPEFDRSVLTSRTLQEIAAGAPAKRSGSDDVP